MRSQRAASGRYARRVAPSTAQSEKWLGVTVSLCAAGSSALLDSLTQRLPSQEYSPSVDSIVGPRSAWV